MLTYTANLYKNAYSGLSKNSWYLSIVMLVNRSGTMVVPFLSIYCIQQLHFTIVQAGTIMALFGLGALAGAFIGGKLVDRIGFYDMQVGALVSGGLLFILLGFLQNFVVLAAGTFILSLCNESFRPANSAAIANYATEQSKTRSFSLNRLAINLGWAVGGGLGGLLASINYHLLFWVDGFTNILAAIMLLLLMPRSAVAKTISQNGDKTLIKTSAYADKVYLVFILFATMFAISFYQFMIMQPVFFKVEWHFDERFIGGLMALNGLLIVAVEMVMIHKLEGRRDKMEYIIFGLFIGAIAYMLLNLLPPGTVAAIIVVIIVTFSEMFAMPFMNAFWLSRCNEHNRGDYAALYSMSWSFAQIVAPFFGSNVIAFGGFKLLWWILGALSLAGTAGYYCLYQFLKRQQSAA